MRAWQIVFIGRYNHCPELDSYGGVLMCWLSMSCHAERNEVCRAVCEFVENLLDRQGEHKRFNDIMDNKKGGFCHEIQYNA